MNTKTITVFVLMVMVLSANAFSITNDIRQDKMSITTAAIFDGYDADDGYAFIIKSDDEEESDEIMYFKEMTDEALKAVNLKSKDMIGKRFEITYEITEHEEEDENGYIETYETYKILKLRKL